MNSAFRILSRLALLALSLAWGANVQAEPLPDSSSLLFRNGDLLYGQLLAIDPQKTVRWQNSDAAEAIDFKPASATEINFPMPSNSPARPTNACRLLLIGGDSLTGSLVSCDHESVVLRTWYAGVLTIPRAALRSLAFIPHSTAVFDGITGLDGWTQGISAAAFPGESGRWIYRNGAFYASKAASIARDFKLPDVAEIQFDVAWRGTLNLAVALYTDSLQPVLLTAKEQGPAFGGFYSLRFQNSSFIDLWPIKKMEPLRQLGQLFIPSLNNKDRLRIDLRVNKPQHKIALFLDDALVKQWDDPQGFIGEGTAMRFVQNPGSVIKLSNLRISEWDGILGGDASAEAADASRDVFWLEKGAKGTGVIESIADGKMTASTTNGPVEIPLTELKSLDFAHHPGAPPSEAGTVRGTFAQGGVLTFILQSWKPDRMIIRSPAFGQATLNPAAFTRLQFLAPEKKASGAIRG